MKTVKLFLILLIFSTGIISCKSTHTVQKSEINITGGEAIKSIDWPGIYQGILPCANCEGIQIQLILNSDLSFLLEMRYNGKDEKILKTKGSFIWSAEANKITLDDSDKQSFLVGENQLFQLDENGSKMSGDLTVKYILEKQKIELTGKYWKLVRLNGKSVKVGNKQPFIIFSKEENRVNGNGGCNLFFGKYELNDGNRVKFSPFAMTKMACIDSNIEDEFMQVTEKTTSYSVTLNELVFQDELETTLAKFEADFFR